MSKSTEKIAQAREKIAFLCKNPDLQINKELNEIDSLLEKAVRNAHDYERKAMLTITLPGGYTANFPGKIDIHDKKTCEKLRITERDEVRTAMLSILDALGADCSHSLVENGDTTIEAAVVKTILDHIEDAGANIER